MEHSKPIYTILEANNVCLFSYKVKTIEPDYKDAVQSYDELKFVRIVQGEGIWTINGINYPVKPDDIIILSRADIRAIRAVTTDLPLVIEQILFLPITVYPWQRCTNFFFERSAGFTNLLPSGSEHYQTVLDGFRSIKSEIDGTGRYKNERIVNILTGMVIQAARLYPDMPKRGISSTQKNQYQIVCNVIAYINEHLMEELSRPRLAKMFFISPSHFSRIFKEYSGFCLQDYIVRCRLMHAIHMIQNQDINVLDAALESGFSSSSGFYRAFHAITGMKPGDLKKNFVLK